MLVPGGEAHGSRLYKYANAVGATTIRAIRGGDILRGSFTNLVWCGAREIEKLR